MIRENIVEIVFGTLHKVFVILSVSEESLSELSYNILRFFTSFRMTNIPHGRNNGRGIGDLNSRYIGLRLIISIVLIINVLPACIFAQNIMQINNVQGVIDKTVTVPISITNDEEFISFQCDVLIPDGFSYISNSIALTPRSVDHVVNVTNIENNTIRILSYSLNNTAFLLDSGIVAKFNLSTPSIEGDYIVGLENGIIGNAQSINIMDSIVAGEITLSLISVPENNAVEDKISCFPNPFNETLTIQLDVDYSQPVKLQVFDLKGMQLSNHNLRINTGINNLSFNRQSLIGSNPPNGTYILHLSLQNKNQIYSIVKKIQLKK